ncbi:MAG: phosphoribosylglycinamide formyltransferase [Geminicoccaceae bacterium]
MAKRRVAVLISGRGSNLQALIDQAVQPAAPVEVALVVSNRAEALGLAHAEAAGIAVLTIDDRGFPDRKAFESELNRALDRAGIEIVCLAGFLRVLTAAFVERWRDRLLNIHPSLLPAFPGLHTHARALAAGVRVHGCTVHLVRDEVDRGPILVQGVVPVIAGDDEESLGARVLELEHRCYPLALELFASGGLSVRNEQVEGHGQRLLLHPLLAGG